MNNDESGTMTGIATTNRQALGFGRGDGWLESAESVIELKSASGPAMVSTGSTARRRDRGNVFSWEQEGEVERWPEPVNGAELLNDLEKFLTRYVVLVKFGTETLALWVLHTYGFQLRDATTYIGLESPQKRCGKTTLLTVLSELVNRPVVASNISSPAFFRVIEEKQPTLMIDEADTVLHKNDELRGILNAGYKRRTAFVVRVTNEVRDGDDVRRRAQERNAGCGKGRKGKTGTRLAVFSCWCPKVIATINHLPETLADRCIVIPMHRKTADEKCERLKGLNGVELRRKCFPSPHFMDHQYLGYFHCLTVLVFEVHR